MSSDEQVQREAWQAARQQSARILTTDLTGEELTDAAWKLAEAFRDIDSPGSVQFPDREHIVQVNAADLATLREWLQRPNGAFTLDYAPRLEFDACGGGVLVRTQPFRAARS